MRALEIDNTLGETHALRAQYHKQLEYNWPEVDREMARALQLSPTSPIVRARYAINALMPHGRLEEAAAELERALEWDPLSTYTRAHSQSCSCCGTATSARWTKPVPCSNRIRTSTWVIS
jgi:Tfp pilus assembly protein PilF